MDVKLMNLRYPVLQQSLMIARKIASNSISQVIDIGVQRKTEFLMDVFPDCPHHLFEPDKTYHQELEKNYLEKKIRYILHKIALSDEDGLLYLHSTSDDGSGNITHAQIKPERDENLPNLVGIEVVDTKRLDSVFKKETLNDLSYLIKLDVDGVEEKIINGGADVIGGASFIVIEASIGRQDLCSRVGLLEQHGFRIFDICDNAYYYGQLALVDLVLINNRLREKEIKFRPWEFSDGKVVWNKWQHGFQDLTHFLIDDPYS